LLAKLAYICGQEEQVRPIVFICHSLRGLGVKQALVTAKLNDRYNDIIRATRGLVFFGTPHRGGNGATVADFASRALGFFAREPPSTLLPVLRKKSIFSESLSEQFQMISHEYKVVSFFEQLPSAVKVKHSIIRTGVTQTVCLNRRCSSARFSFSSDLLF
jgi:hypothetical protein